MANIRIDNASGDMLNVRLGGNEYSLPEDESLTIQNAQKGRHKLTVSKSRRIGRNDEHSEREAPKLPSDDESQYILLDSEFEIETNSSKAVLTVRNKPTLVEKVGVDALFSGCEIEISGGKTIGSRYSFAGQGEKKKFMKKQLKNAFFPIGIGIVIFTVLVIIALAANISGNPITLGGRKFTYPWTFGLAGIDLVFIGYFSFMLRNILTAAKKYKI